MIGTDFYDRLNQIIEGQVNDHSIGAFVGCPAVSIALLHNGSIIPHCLSSEDSLINSHTLFQACSISKSIAAVAVFRSVQDGCLKLGDSITKHLTGDQLEAISSGNGSLPFLERITIEQLLSHTSGLSQHGFEGYATEPLPTILQVLSGQPPSNSLPIHLVDFPGAGVRYSGGGFVVLQAILENIYSEAFGDIIERLVLNPLGMADSCYKLDAGRAGTQKDYLIYAYSTGNCSGKGGYNSFTEQAAAGLWTTPTDMLKLVQAIQSSLLNGDESFLQSDLTKSMLAEVQKSRTRGWKISDDSSIFFHPGDNLPGYCSLLIGFTKTITEIPDLSKPDGIAVMVNCLPGHAIITKVVHAAANILGWPQRDLDAIWPVLEAKPFMLPGQDQPQGWRRWEGKYAASVKGNYLRLFAIDEKPFISYGQSDSEDDPIAKLWVAAVGEPSENEVCITLVADILQMVIKLKEDSRKQPIMTMYTPGSSGKDLSLCSN